MSTDNHLDPDILQGLREVMEDQFPALIAAFIADSEERIGSLQTALAAQDGDTLCRQAHSLKGSCHNIGALRLGELCQELEDRGRAEQLQGLGARMVAVQEEFAQLKATLNGLIG